MHLGLLWPHPCRGVTAQNSPPGLAALITVKFGQRPRLMYRNHPGRRDGKDRRKGFTEADYARLIDAAHPSARRPARAGVEQPQRPRQPCDDRVDRRPSLADGLPSPRYAHEFDPLEPVWSHLKRPWPTSPSTTSPSSPCW